MQTEFQQSHSQGFAPPQESNQNNSQNRYIGDGALQTQLDYLVKNQKIASEVSQEEARAIQIKETRISGSLLERMFVNFRLVLAITNQEPTEQIAHSTTGSILNNIIDIC